MIADIPLLTYDKPASVIPTEDDLHLQSYETKLPTGRDYVRGVVLGVSNGVLPCAAQAEFRRAHRSQRIREVGG